MFLFQLCPGHIFVNCRCISIQIGIQTNSFLEIKTYNLSIFLKIVKIGKNMQMYLIYLHKYYITIVYYAISASSHKPP